MQPDSQNFFKAIKNFAEEFYMEKYFGIELRERHDRDLASTLDSGRPFKLRRAEKVSRETKGNIKNKID